MTDTLLFLHLLSAAAIFCALVAFSAVALGARLDGGTATPFLWLWRFGLLGVLIFGVALALDIDGYQLWDTWILIAFALWFVAGGVGDKVANTTAESGALPRDLVARHWLSVFLVVLLLADMVWKPWT
jgi:hypothetical protein